MNGNPYRQSIILGEALKNEGATYEFTVRDGKHGKFEEKKKREISKKTIDFSRKLKIIQ